MLLEEVQTPPVILSYYLDITPHCHSGLLWCPPQYWNTLTKHIVYPCREGRKREGERYPDQVAPSSTPGWRYWSLGGFRLTGAVTAGRECCVPAFLTFHQSSGKRFSCGSAHHSRYSNSIKEPGGAWCPSLQLDWYRGKYPGHKMNKVRGQSVPLPSLSPPVTVSEPLSPGLLLPGRPSSRG